MKKIPTETLLLAIATTLNIASWLWVAFAIPASALPIIIRHNAVWGWNLLGERPMIFTAPLLGAVILFVNTGLVWIFKDARRALMDSESSFLPFPFLRIFVAGGTVLLQILVLVVVWFVISINT